jgi:hypothetical protein
MSELFRCYGIPVAAKHGGVDLAAIAAEAGAYKHFCTSQVRQGRRHAPGSCMHSLGCHCSWSWSARMPS